MVERRHLYVHRNPTQQQVTHVWSEVLPLGEGGLKEGKALQAQSNAETNPASPYLTFSGEARAEQHELQKQNVRKPSAMNVVMPMTLTFFKYLCS